jgi:hypothetical protein
MENTIKAYHKQFVECGDAGLTEKTEFESFEEHPENLPRYPKEGMLEAIKTGMWTGIDFIICGKFGGRCSSRHAECRKMRGYIE